ncbi:MAG: hypothetical protein KGQ66_03495 [Acidobacteriota bacterium]|nr:hypothetical protein [Acidobacteriota bacterium]
MTPDIEAVDDAVAVAVLLHPHPSYGGNRHHPFIDGLYRRLPALSVPTVRFDFNTSEMAGARAQTAEVVRQAGHRWPGVPVMLMGYSFGAAVAAGTGEAPVGAWFLLAPPAVMLADSTIGLRPGTKAVVVPEFDQYSTPALTAEAVSGWSDTEVSVLAGCDHFLGTVTPAVDLAAAWVSGRLAR